MADTGPTLIKERVDWRSFLERHDLVWKRLPREWREAAWLGNGRLVLSMYQEPESNALRFPVDRTDVYDRRDSSWGWSAYSRARYHVGDFQLYPVGAIKSIEMRQALYDAELRGTLRTGRGQIRFRAFAHAVRPLMVIELEPSEGESECGWVWRPYPAETSRPDLPRDEEGVRAYEKQYGQTVRIWEPNPPPERTETDGVQVCVQRLLAGGGYATAWREAGEASDEGEPTGKRVLYISAAMSHPELTSPGQAVEVVKEASSTGMDELLASHRQWWHDYYPASFVSLPDTKVESFYWIQMFKYACAVREDTGPIDTHGPWLQPTTWPYTTYDLNTQISYWALQPANRLELSESLFGTLDKHCDNLIANVRPVAYQDDSACIGIAAAEDLISALDEDCRYERCWSNLPWVCHNYWLQYRYSMDDERLRRNLFPLLRRAINLYLHYVQERDDGRLHLPPTFSPEYYAPDGRSLTRDCNIDLALLKWGCQTLLRICHRLEIDDPLMPYWRDVVERLVDFPTDENGLMIGRDIPFDGTHRHMAHLIAIHPLYLLNGDHPEHRPLIETSLKHWVRPELVEDYLNFSAASASLMYASMGDSEQAYHQFMLSFETMFPNTMFSWSGQNMETPLVTVQPIHDMLLQSWEGVIRVFPAVPDVWQDVVFHNLRAEGAFLVSAVRGDGQTLWVRIKSLAGEPCRLRIDVPAPLKVASGPPVPIISLGAKEFDIGLVKGQEVLLAWGEISPELGIAPLAAEEGRTNQYGLS